MFSQLEHFCPFKVDPYEKEAYFKSSYFYLILFDFIFITYYYYYYYYYFAIFAVLSFYKRQKVYLWRQITEHITDKKESRFYWDST